jgi:hypothetical protein
MAAVGGAGQAGVDFLLEDAAHALALHFGQRLVLLGRVQPVDTRLCQAVHPI